MRKVNWYIGRLSSMSGPEVFYRIGQQVQKLKEKKQGATVGQCQDYKQVLRAAQALLVLKEEIPADLLAPFGHFTNVEIFGEKIDITGTIDWHIDANSGKRFPIQYSKDINIRSDAYGSAKVVWEINRLQFLLPLAVKYIATKKEEDLQLFIRIIKNWNAENPYLKGVNWYSNIEINIRLVVWYFCWQILWRDPDLQKNTSFVQFTLDTWLPAIYHHCIYSFKNPSRYSSANNHMIAEYAGLFVASHCWPFKEAPVWEQYAKKGMEKQIILQHSENGINKEEAAEYIQFITDFFLIAYSVGEKNNVHFSETYKSYLHKIFHYIYNLLDINGGYTKYGDEDDGKVLLTSPAEDINNFDSLLMSGAILFEESDFKLSRNSFDFKNWLLWGNNGRLIYENLPLAFVQKQSTFYTNEGHFIFRKTYKRDKQKEIYFHFDAAPLGFLSIAAHGHADVLSVTLTLDGYPILVDVGTYCYHTHKEWRRYFVSTLAHNTICIDHINQANFIGSNLWLQHYKVNIIAVNQHADTEMVSAEHSGYEKINCRHVRTVHFDKPMEKFILTDEIFTNKRSHHILQPWHLHPQVSVEKENRFTYILQHQQGSRKIRLRIDPRLNIAMVKGETNPILGWFSSSFMQKEKTNVLLGETVSTPGDTVQLNTEIQVI